MRPLLYIVRHGETEANNQKKFRGWTKFPLDETGRKSAAALSDYFSDKPLAGVVSSDLPRAVETAQTIYPGAQTDPGLRPLHVGTFAGKSRDENWDKFKTYLHDPSKRIPKGESLNQFRKRFEFTLKGYLEKAKRLNDPLLLVSHTSNVTAAKHFVSPSDQRVPEESDVVEPGGLVAIYPHGSGYRMEKV